MNEKYLIPVSIIISSLILGLGIYFTNLTNKEFSEEKEVQKKEKTLNIKKVDPETDHIQGSKTADIFIIEYSDLECAGCKAFSKIEKALIKKYEDNPRVAFVYRHFPLYKTLGDAEPVHPTSGVEARATECAGKLAGEKTFWKMRDRIFNTTKSDGHYPVENLSSLAEEFGINKVDFGKCIESEEIEKKIELAWKEAYDAGINTTPSIYIQIKQTGEVYKAIPGRDIIDKAIQAYLKNS